MFNKSKEFSLIDIRIYVISFLSSVAWSYIITKSFFSLGYTFISIAICLFIANSPFLFFVIGMHFDKGWILSILGIENDHVISKSKEMSLGFSIGGLGGAVISLLFEDVPDNMLLNLLTIVLGIYFTSRMLTQVIGFYVYWIARINGDKGLKVEVTDEMILKRSLVTASFNYRVAILISVILSITLITYFFAECFFSLTSPTRAGFLIYSTILFSWVVLCFFLVQVFNKNAILLRLSLHVQLLDEHSSILEKSLREQLFFTKFMFVLFLFVEVIILIYCKDVK